MCLVKQDDWAYEAEWRIVSAIGPDHANFGMEMPKPTAVLLGAQVTCADEDVMRHLCMTRSIALKRMVQKPGTFELAAEQVPLH
jgi:hypothetical protein